MLRITMSKSASGAKKYYSEEYYSEGKSAHSNYYTDKDQVIGKWGGIGAEKLGLNDAVLKSDFGKLCDNINPESNKTLTGRQDVDRTVGYDFTFNASKSVSLAYMFGNEQDKQEILNAFRLSVSDTMKEVERGMQARVRTKGRNENRETGNIVYGEFSHFTTRPIDGVPDPHLHSHCFVFNATYDEKEEKWKAGNFRQINQDAPYYEAYFHSKLAERLTACSYGIELNRHGFEIAGISKDLLDKFSRRTKEIEEHAKENNITDDKQKAQIGARTREAKRADIDAGKEMAEWKERLSGEEYSSLLNLKKHNSVNTIRPEAARDAIEYALNHHLERKSVASDKEILAMAIKTSIGRASPEQVKSDFSKYNEILSVKEGGRTFITTRQALAKEKQLIHSATTMRGRFKPINEGYEIKPGLLNDQQKKAVTHALSTTDGVIIISGRAGTGKTTLMREVKEGINDAGKEIHSFAPSAEASRVVQRAEGFGNADTLASLIQNKDLQNRLKGQVIWIDEGGLVSGRDMNKVLEIAAQQNARVIVSGDVRQHNSVERGDALRIMERYAGIKPVTVDKIQRQRNSDYKQAVKLLSEAKIESSIKKLAGMGAINQVEDAKARVKAVADDYCDSTFKGRKPGNVLVIAPTHAEGDLVTAEIRNRLKEKGVLGEQVKQVTILKNLQFTDAEKQVPHNYRQGLIVSLHQNIKGAKAGAKLEAASTTESCIIARDTSGKEYKIGFDQSKRFNVFESKRIELAVGDKIRITGNGRTVEGKHLFNGTALNVTGFDRKGNIRLSNGSTLPNDYGHFGYGYVMTSHSSQGKTTDKIIISQSSMSSRAASMEQFYVSVSRGRQAVAIYTDDKEELLKAVSNSSQRLSATELLEQAKRTKTSIENGRLSKIFEIKKNMAERLRPTKNIGYELPGKS